MLELRSVRGTGGGPEKTILMGAARTDSSKYAVTVCYIRDKRDNNFGPGTKAALLPVDYVEVLERNSFDPAIWFRIREIVHKQKIDIVHAHDYKADLLALLLARSDGVIPLSTAHGWTGHTLREQIYYWGDRKILRRFRKIIAVSSQIRDELVTKGIPKDKTEVILNGIDAQAFKRDPGRCETARKELGVPLGKTVIGSIGRLEPQKNYDLLIDAFAELRKRFGKLFLAIAGHGSLASHLESKANRMDLKGAYRFLGHQSDVALVHHAFDVFVQSSDYEGTANAVLEAMALETPIIATDVGGTTELVRDGLDGLIIPPKDQDELCRSLVEVLDNREQGLLRAKAARGRVETDLSFEVRMRKVEALYEQLMNA